MCFFHGTRPKVLDRCLSKRRCKMMMVTRKRAKKRSWIRTPIFIMSSPLLAVEVLASIAAPDRTSLALFIGEQWKLLRSRWVCQSLTKKLSQERNNITTYKDLRQPCPTNYWIFLPIGHDHQTPKLHIDTCSEQSRRHQNEHVLDNLRAYRVVGIFSWGICSLSSEAS